MPPRRSHKKSKDGCQRCKSRKIKCDEVHPVCGNCTKHGVPCDFESSESPSASTPSIQFMAESPSSFGTAPTPRSITSSMIPMYQTPTAIIRSRSSPEATRSLELKLMHHYTATTSQTLSDKSEQKRAWQMSIPAIAYDTQYLMDAILAVSALHLRVLHPNDQAVVRASHGYMASALEQYSSLLRDGELSELNAEALFSTSALIAFQASASRKFDQDQGYTLPLAWFHSFQGVKTMVMASWQWLRDSEKIFPIIGGQPALTLDFDPERKLFFSPLLEGMALQLLSEPDHTRLETKQAYEHSVAFLNWAHQKPERARILGFAAAVSRRFVGLISEHDPRALVILACFFAMTKVCDDVWWLEGLAKREVEGISSILPSEWWGKMEWPLHIVNHVGEKDDATWGASASENEMSFKEEDSSADVRAHIDMLAQIMNEQAPPLPPD